MSFAVPERVLEDALGSLVFVAAQVDVPDPPQAHGAVDHVLPPVGAMGVAEQAQLHGFRVHAFGLDCVSQSLAGLGDAEEGVGELVLPLRETVVVRPAAGGLDCPQDGRPVNEERLSKHVEGVGGPAAPHVSLAEPPHGVGEGVVVPQRRCRRWWRLLPRWGRLARRVPRPPDLALPLEGARKGLDGLGVVAPVRVAFPEVPVERDRRGGCGAVGYRDRKSVV